MEALLGDPITSEVLREHEAKYFDEQRKGCLTPQTRFEYAWCLIRSKHPSDLKLGVEMLEELCQNGDSDARRDYLFYLAVGNTKLKDYARARQLVEKFLSVEPTNRQAQELEKYIQERLTKEGLLGMAIVGGATLAGGAIVIAGTVTYGLMSLGKRLWRRN